jgi:hypothetical protein
MGPDSPQPAAEQLLQRGDLRAGQVPHVGIARLKREARKSVGPIILQIVQGRGCSTAGHAYGQGAEPGLPVGARSGGRSPRKRGTGSVSCATSLLSARQPITRSRAGRPEPGTGMDFADYDQW